MDKLEFLLHKNVFILHYHARGFNMLRAIGGVAPCPNP